MDRSGVRSGSALSAFSGWGWVTIAGPVQAALRHLPTDLPDDNGVSINAKDKRGRSPLKLLAGETGVELTAEKP